eukprot:13564033-Alexandrium_andersonii.AAC.1
MIWKCTVSHAARSRRTRAGRRSTVTRLSRQWASALAGAKGTRSCPSMTSRQLERCSAARPRGSG